MKKLLAAALLLAPAAAGAQTPSPLTPAAVTSRTYSQNFDTLASSGTANAAFPTGFGIVESGANADGLYAAGTGSANTGNAYSFGAAGGADRALGALTSGGVSPVTFGGVFTNGLGAAITSISLSYAGEQWRAAAANTLVFEYSTNATSLVNGVWTRAAAFDFAAPVVNTANPGALDGNAAPNRRVIDGVLSNLLIANGGGFGFRWTLSDAPGSDPGLAIDDFAFTATAAVPAVPEPASWALTIAGFGMAGAALRRRTAAAFA